MLDDLLIDRRRLTRKRQNSVDGTGILPAGARAATEIVDVHASPTNVLSTLCVPENKIAGHQGKRQVKGKVDLIKAAQVVNEYNESLPIGFPKLSIRPGCESDLKVAYEVLRNDGKGCYDGRDPYGIRAGEEVLDLGSNIGVSCHWFLRQGARKVTCIEPAEMEKPNGIWHQLVINCGDFKQVDLRNIGVSSQNEVAAFNDHDETKAGGSRSCKAKHDTYIGHIAKNVRVYDVRFETLESIMRTCNPHVIKCDVEGSDFEAFMVSDGFKFGRARLIMLETSSARARRESTGWHKLASVIKTLLEAGFKHAKFPAALYKRKHWVREECSGFVKNRDDIICFWRNRYDEKGKEVLRKTSRKTLKRWRKFRRFAKTLSKQEAMACA